MDGGITVLAVALIAFASVSGRLRGSWLTPAILFTGAGFVVGTEVLDIFGSGLDVGNIRLLAELTLALVLFGDASALEFRTLSHEAGFPARLLGVGLPLTIVLGAGVALWLFPDLLLFEAIVLAVLLAPTDAALGQTVVSDTRLPSRVRQGLNAESGLNDGVCVPLLFAAVAFAELEEAPSFEGEIIIDLVKEVGIAIAVGLVVAMAVGYVVNSSKRRGWLDVAWAQVVPIATAAIAYTTTDELGGSGFIAAFVAGLIYGRRVGASTAHSTTRLMEEVGGVLSAATFFVFGAVLIGAGVIDFDVSTIVYAALSLTVIRMVPVALSLVGSGATLPTMAFTGWFGPRGLATIVFTLTIIEEANLVSTDRIVQVATVTVLFSVVAHGVSAPWLTDRYVRWLSTRDGSSEPDSAPTSRTRRSLWAHRPQNQH